MAKLHELPETTFPLDNDYFFVVKDDGVIFTETAHKANFKTLRPGGVFIQAYHKFQGSLTIPDIAGGGGGLTWSFNMTGARETDQVIINWVDGLPAGLGVMAVRAVDRNEVEIRMRNFAVSDFNEDTVPITALLIRWEESPPDYSSSQS